jgi:hypothetical protein
VVEKEIKFDALTTMDPRLKVIDFSNGRLQSSFIHGTMKGRVKNYDAKDGMELDGMEVDFSYIPDKLNTVLSPWLSPYKLVGDKERRITGKLQGKAKGEGMLALLRGSTGNFDMSVGQVVAEGFKMDAALKTEVKDGVMKIDGPADVNGGKMDVTGNLSLADPSSHPTSQFGFTANKVNLNAENGNILALISGTTEKAGNIEGQLNTNLQGTYTGDLADLSLVAKPTKELTPELQQRQAAARQGLKMNGSLNIDNFVAHGSSFVSGLTQFMDLGQADVPGYLKIPDLKIENGASSFQQCEMRVQHTVIRMWGSITFDRKLHLTMRVPIDPKMLKLVGVSDKDAKEYIGKTVDVPVRGTTEKPEMDFSPALTKVAEKVLQKQVEKGIQDIFKPKKKDKK